MVSVDVELLDKSESDLYFENRRIRQMVNKLRAIQNILSSQCENTFASQISELNRSAENLNQVMETFDILGSSLRDIKESYCNCEQKNTFYEVHAVFTDHLISKNPWDLIFKKGKDPCYKIDEIDKTYETWISPLINER